MTAARYAVTAKRTMNADNNPARKMEEAIVTDSLPARNPGWRYFLSKVGFQRNPAANVGL